MKIIICALLTLMVISNAMSNDINKTNTEQTKFGWDSYIVAPCFYPVFVQAFVGFGTEDKRYHVHLGRFAKGLEVSKASTEVNDFGKEMEIPKSIDIVWISVAEKQIYTGNFEFSEELQETILNYFRTGYTRLNDDNIPEKITYDKIGFTLLPGGRLFPHLDGFRRVVCLDTMFQCKKVDKGFLPNFGFDFPINTLEEYVKLMYYDAKNENGNDLQGYYEKYGIPYELWDRYLETFNYDLKIEFENEETVFDSDYSWSFTNGEIFIKSHNVEVNFKARPKILGFAWKVADTTYRGSFFFNENDVLEIFDKAYGNDPTQKGELVIRVNKNSNLFKIYLLVGDKKYHLNNELFTLKTRRKTSIHVFREYPGQDPDEPIFYNNHREIHSSLIKFIGE